jgi:cystathionine beta-lyase/cystathionine gamma-synthase
MAIRAKERQMAISRKFKGIETKLIHAGDPEPRIGGAVTMPIFQSVTFEYTGSSASYHDIRYIRLSNTPNHTALGEKLAALENAEAAIVTASGMAAISTTLLTLLGAGDHVLVQNCLYGGTHDLITGDFPALRIGYDFVDGDDPRSWRTQLRDNTRAIYVETMSNPLLQVADLGAVVEFASHNGLVSIIDNTFASPINFRPAEIGFDLSIHSCTKYLNGHDDVVAGAIIGRAELIEKIRRKLNHLGGSLDPHACFLLERGIKTLAVRVRYQNESALRIARYLESHLKVAHVNYPGLEGYPNYLRARALFEGFGGMLSFEPKGDAEQAERFMRAVAIPICAPSLGGVHTLVTRPAATSHAGLAPEERARAGISDRLVRISVGLEATEDLIEDFDRALATC